MTEKTRLVTLIGRLEADEGNVRKEIEKAPCGCPPVPPGCSKIIHCLRCDISSMLSLMREIFEEAKNPTEQPAPDVPTDGLVEALKAFADPANWEWDSSGWTWVSDVKPRILADTALAAHEKAVR